MAHYVAELMEAAENTTLEVRDAAERRCALAILELWDHRAGLSNWRVPADFGSVVAVLNRLDPAAPQPAYFRVTWEEIERDDTQGTMDETAKIWLRCAEQIDKAARETILYAVRKAAEVQTERAKPWVELAEAAGADGAADIQLIRRLIVMTGQDQPENIAEIEELKDKLSRLSEFRSLVEKIEAEWRAQLESALATVGT